MNKNRNFKSKIKNILKNVGEYEALIIWRVSKNSPEIFVLTFTDTKSQLRSWIRLSTHKLDAVYVFFKKCSGLCIY